MAAQIQTSPRFASQNSDITCRSADNVNFKLHSVNIELHSNLIKLYKNNKDKASDADLHVHDTTALAESTVALLPETSDVLEILFQFMYNQPQPDLATISLATLSSLITAVEKYQAFAAVESCKARLRDYISQYPLRVLSISANYKYTSLMDEAATHTITVPLKDVQSTLKPPVFNAWVRYHRSWMDLLNQVYAYQEPTRWHWEGIKDKGGVKAMDSPCEVWTEIWAKVAYRFAGKPESLLHVDEIFQQTKEVIGLRCMSCPKWIADWHKEVTYQMNKLSKFSTFL